jgi:N-acetylmuramic acid 6-phosphate etherase
MIRLGKVYSNLMVDMRATNEKLRRRAARLVQLAAGGDAAAAEQSLVDANGEVKTAIAALHLGITPEEARRRLEDVGGRLRLLFD